MIIVVLLVDLALHAPNAEHILQAPILTVWVNLIIKAALGAAAYIASHILFWQLQGRSDGPERSIIIAIKPRLPFFTQN
jgi:hypothetical protein